MAHSNLPYEVITNKILEKLEQGVIPWYQPWCNEMPKNLISRKEYRGINVILLGSQGYANPYWLTFNQAKSLGGHVRKGEKATPVVFWKWLEKETGETDENGDPIVDHIPLLRYYSVFNVSQCEDLDESKIPAVAHSLDFEPIEQAERIVSNMPKRPSIRHGESRAYYRPSTDSVHMPPQVMFQSREDYYNVLFHELTHSTGHPERLGRFDPSQPMAAFGSADYSQEELVAEMGAAFLCWRSGIENKHTFENSAAYIAGWLRRLRDDSKLLVFAAARAQKAADFIQNRPGNDNSGEA